MSWVSTPPGFDYYDDETKDETNGDEEEGEEEPWLDTPERLRLILGLVAEFTEGSVSKVESEVSPTPLISFGESVADATARQAARIPHLAGGGRG